MEKKNRNPALAANPGGKNADGGMPEGYGDIHRGGRAGRIAK